MKLLAFGASTSSNSINRQLANYAASQVPGAQITDLDLRQFELPMYSTDEQSENGIPQAAHDFLDLIRSHDGIVVSLAEHNGSYTAAFKNLYDWTSRIEKHLWSGKPMFLLSTSPGGRGGATVMATAAATFPRMGASLIAAFTLPSFQANFSPETGITDSELARAFQQAASAFAQSLTPTAE
jgi:NAD(P)H-dependent FMN reductase